MKALQEVPGIGPWTAACAAADFTGDYSVYPHSDLAVRTWAAKAAPEAVLADTRMSRLAALVVGEGETGTSRRR